MRKTQSNNKRQFVEKVKGYFYIILCISLVISLLRNISRIKRADERISRASERVESLEQKKAELEKRIEETQSDIYLETQLRDGLGLAREEEIVIILPEEEVLRRIAPDIEQNTQIVEEVPIWKKWISLFLTVEN